MPFLKRLSFVPAPNIAGRSLLLSVLSRSIICLVLISFAGCDSGEARRQRTHDELAYELSLQLAHSGLNDISVRVTDSEVVLSGHADPRDQLLAEQFARDTAGNRSIRVDLKPYEHQPEVPVDLGLRVRIEAALSSEVYWPKSRIKVEVNDARVTLTGNVPDEHARSRSAEVAEAVTGVIQVDNRLTLSTP